MSIDIKLKDIENEPVSDHKDLLHKMELASIERIGNTAPAEPEEGHNEVDEPEDIIESEAVPNQPPVLSTPEKARLQGWKPQNEFHGDPDLWCDAKEFIHRGSYLKRIDQLEKMVEATAQTAAKARELGFKQALTELEAKRQISRASGDFESYDRINTEINQLHNNFTVTPGNPAQIPNQPQFYQSDYWKQWETQNPWFKGTDEKSLSIQSACRDILAPAYRNANPNATLYDESVYIANKVRELNFFNPNTNPAPKTSKVAGVTNNTTRNDPKPTGRGGAVDEYEKTAAKLAASGQFAMAGIIRHLGRRKQDWKGYYKEVQAQGSNK